MAEAVLTVQIQDKGTPASAAGPPRAPGGPPAGADPAERAARRAMEAELFALRVDQARRLIDSEYALRKAKEEEIITPLAAARAAAVRAMDAQLQAEEIDAQRRLIDSEYAQRKAKEEELRAERQAREMLIAANPALYAARQAMEAELQAQRIDAERRGIDAAYAQRRAQEEQAQAERQAREAEAAANPALYAAKRAMEAELQAERIDQERRGIDAAYAQRKAQEEQLQAERQARAAALETPRGAARAAMERDEFARRVDQQRRLIDTEYAQRKTKEEAAERLGAAAKLAMIAQGVPGAGLVRAGLGGAAAGQAAGAGLTSLLGEGAAGAAAAMPVVGAVIAVANEIKQKIEEGLKEAFKFSTAVLSLDPDKLARGFADLASKVPIVGGLLGSFAHGLLDMLDALDQTARRLAAYNPALAVQIAQFDIQNMMRDMQRAQEMGPQIMEAMQARQNLRERWQDLLDKLAPAMLNILENLLSLIEGAIEISKAQWNAFLNSLQAIADMFPGLGDAVREQINQLRAIERNTRPEPPPADLVNNLLAQLRETVIPPNTMPGMPLPTGVGALPAFGL